MQRPIGWESLLEQDAIYHFEFCTLVMSYQEQPEMIEFWVKGKRHVYFPDFELILRSGEIIHVEVKPKSKLKDADLRKRLQHIEAHYQRRGTRFLILTEDQIRNKVVLDNLKQLAYHCRWELDDEGLLAAIEAMTLLPAATVDGASALLGSERDVYRLLASGAYACDLQHTISGSTAIWAANEESSYATISF
jgi:hypothetical protein